MSDARDCTRKNSGDGDSDVERVMSRKVTILDTSVTRRTTSGLNEMTTELQLDERTMRQDLLGGLSYSLSGMKKNSTIGRNSDDKCLSSINQCHHH